MMRVQLIIEDEVNARFENLAETDIAYIIKHTELKVKGSHLSPAFKTHNWNGKESQFHSDGTTYQYMLPRVFTLLESLRYNLDNDIDFVDTRVNSVYQPAYINEFFLSEYGIDLRYYQVEAVNAVIEKMKGFIEVATAGGKTYVAAAIVKAFDFPYRAILITNNDNLVTDSKKAFDKVGLDSVIINGELNKAKKKAAFAKHRHVITTWQTLNNNREYLKNFDVIIYDEAHIMGDVMFELFVNELAHCPVRVGMTGTVPLDKQKREKIFTRIGGDILYNIEQKKLADEGWIAKAEVTLIQTKDDDKTLVDLQKSKETWNWDLEKDYLMGNRDRLRALAKFISGHTTENTLILCHAEAGAHLAKLMGYPFIDHKVSPDDRIELYKEFARRKDMKLTATYNTVGTGISIDDIFDVFLIDPGKDYTTIVQGIGRGCRLDTEGRNIVRVWDVSSDTFFSKNHKRERVKIYKDRGYHFVEAPYSIKVEHETD